MARHTKTARATNQDWRSTCTESSIAQVQASQVVYVVGKVAKERTQAVIHRLLLERSVQRAEECSVTHVQRIEVQSRRKYDCLRQHPDGHWTYGREDLDRLRSMVNDLFDGYLGLFDRWRSMAKGSSLPLNRSRHLQAFEKS
jgi:hypothetical protein